MDFHEHIKSTCIDLLEFIAIAGWFAYLYFSLWSFINATFALNYVNFQTCSYIAYSVLMLLLPVVLMWSPSRINKPILLTIICFGFALVMLVGSVADLIKYKAFIDYAFQEGDAIFVNLIMNLPNLWGVLFCLILSALYVFFGITLVKKPVTAYFTYSFIFIIDAIVPLIFAIGINHTLPRLTWIQKSMFLLPMQLLILVSLTLAVTSRKLWSKIIY